MAIIKDSLIYIFGEVFAKALPFLLLPYLTRRLGVAGFGELSLYQTYFAVLIILFSLCQDGAITRYFYVYGKRNLSYLMLTGYIYTIFIALIGLFMAWLYQSLVWASVILASMAQSMVLTQLAVRQCQKMAKDYIAIQLSSGIIATLLTILLLEIITYHAIAWRFLAIFLASFLVFGLSGWLFWKKQADIIKKKPTIKRLFLNFSYILSVGIPTFFHQLSGVLKGQFDRLFIYQKFDVEHLGLYASGHQVAMVFSVLLLAINKAAVPYYYEAIKSGVINQKKVLRWALLSSVMVPIPSVLAILVPESFFLALLGKDYVGVKYYVCCFLLAFGLMIPYLILVSFLFYHAKNKQISFVSILSLIIYIISLFYLGNLGQFYVPIALIISNLIMIFLLAYLVKNHYEYK